MSIVLMLSTSTIVFADSNSNGQATSNQRNIHNGKSVIGDNKTVVSDVLTFDQLVQIIAEDNNISKEEAIKIVLEEDAVSEGTDYMQSASFAEASTSTYRTISSQFTVTFEYKPELRFYCETNEGGGYWGIIRILNVGMNRSYNGMTKQFGGTVYTYLENSGTIFWIVNGDFYDNGTTTYNGGVSIGIGESSSVSFGASYTTNYYSYCYEEGYYIIQ